MDIIIGALLAAGWAYLYGHSRCQIPANGHNVPTDGVWVCDRLLEHDQEQEPETKNVYAYKEAATGSLRDKE
jgi:hypothetical protein